MVLVNGLVQGTTGTIVPVGVESDGSLRISPASANRPIFTDTESPLALSATFNGVARDFGEGFSKYKTFEAVFYADQAGTAVIQASVNGTTWRPAAQASMSAGAPVSLQVPITARYYRVQCVNGATAQTQLMITSGATAV